MSLNVYHALLVSGQDFDTCARRVLHFFASTQLVRYDDIHIIREESCSAQSEKFQPLLELVIRRNRDRLKALLADLQTEGYTETASLLDLPQGFLSKTLHTIAHMEDGFFGIDAAFFDVDEFSLRLTSRRRQLINDQPEQCWLVNIRARSRDGGGFES